MTDTMAIRKQHHDYELKLYNLIINDLSIFTICKSSLLDIITDIIYMQF